MSRADTQTEVDALVDWTEYDERFESLNDLNQEQTCRNGQTQAVVISSSHPKERTLPAA